MSPRRRASWPAGAACAWALFASVACGTAGPEPEAPFAVRIGVVDGPAHVELGSDDVRRALVQSLEAAPDLVLSDGDEALEIGLAWREMEESSQSRQILVQVFLEVPPERRKGPLAEPLEAMVLLERDAPANAGLRDDVGMAVGRAISVLQAKLDLAENDVERVAQLAADDDAELRLLALEWIRDHGRSAGSDVRVRLADAAVACLAHSDERVRRTAVEAVGRAGTARHAADLIAAVRLSDEGQTHRAYDALATLGGPEARGFLEFAARNEDEPVRRAAARAALDRLERPRASTPRDASPALRGHR